jgi:hypothetical protein
MPARVSRREWAGLTLLVLFSGFLSLALGQDISWDLRNYHFYNPYAFLGGRLTWDLAPAGIQSFLNPLPDLIHYWGLTQIPGMPYGFLLGTLQGLVILPIYGICREVFTDLPRERFCVGISLLLGLTGQNAVSQLGATANDNLISILALSALWIILRQMRKESFPMLFLAGALLGAAAGFKLTFGYLLLAALAALFLVAAKFTHAGVVGVGAVAGFLVSYGFWAWRLSTEFQNPVFPLFNGIFQSSWVAETNFRDPRFKANVFWDYLLPPVRAFQGAHKSTRLQEIPFRDLRLLFLFLSALALMMVRIWRKPKIRLKDPQRFLLWTWGLGYLLWIQLFFYYRYLTPLEFLAPALGVLMLVSAGLDRKWALGSFAAFILLTTQYGFWGRQHWRENWAEVIQENLEISDESVVFLSEKPVGYLLRYFPARARFVHLNAFPEFGAPTARYRERIAEIVGGSGPFYLFSSRPSPIEVGQEKLVLSGECKPAQAEEPTYYLCPLRKNPAPSAKFRRPVPGQEKVVQLTRLNR